jgi:hypothetical protein
VPGVAQRSRQVAGERREHLGVGVLQVRQPVALDAAERVGAGGGEFHRGQHGGALGVGDHGEARIQPDQGGAVPEPQQGRVGVGVGHLYRDPAGRGRLGQPYPSGDPQQRADRFPQLHGGAVGDLQHGGQLAAVAAQQLEDRIVVVQQQRGRPVGADLVHQRGRRRGSGADQ